MVWTCCKCIAKYSSWSQLDVHLLSHARERINDEKDDALECGSCTRSFDTHCNSVDIEDILLCAHCDQVFSDKLLIELHLKIEHRDMFPQTSLFICQVCGSRLFMRLCDIRRHMQRDHCQFLFDVDLCIVSKLQDTIFPCQVCGVLCVLSRYCVDHKSSAPASSTLTSTSKCIEHGSLFPNCHSCQKCDESFDNCKTLWSHMFLTHENADFVCNLCPLDAKKVVRYPHLLEKHMKQKHAMPLQFPTVHTFVRNKAGITMQDVTQYKCFECPAILANYSSFKGHISEIHNTEKDFPCHFCNKLFIRNNYLMKHIRDVHQKVSNHTCDDCGRTYTSLSSLREHIRTFHSSEKSFVCETCGESFFSRGRLKTHKYSHTESRFCCSTCGKSYKNPMILKLHIQETHTKPMKSICDICGSKLKSERLLKAHLATVHTTERAFVCDICSASYKYKKHLTHHYKKHQK